MPPNNSALNAPIELYLALYLPVAGGTLTGPLILSADPTVALGAATKQYADTKLTKAQADTYYTTQVQTDTWYLKLSGGTVTGPIVLPGDPTQPLQATDKRYVDNQITALQAQITQNTNDIASLKTRMTTAETNISNNTASINTINSQIATINSNLSALSATVSNLNQQIIDLQSRLTTDENTLADHEQRIRKLEGEQTVPTDPYIGAVVHVVDQHGKCQPAIVYEDWKATNAPDVASVVVVSPYRLSISEWGSKIEVQRENLPSAGEIPFNFWHWPERYYGQRKLQIFR